MKINKNNMNYYSDMEHRKGIEDLDYDDLLTPSTEETSSTFTVTK